MIEMKLAKYCQEIEKAQHLLQQIFQKEIPSYKIQSALCEKKGYAENRAMSLLNDDLSAEDMIELLLGYDFSIPEVLQVIEMPESILPPSIIVVLDEQRIKMKGEIWKIHKYDADPFPSNPHAHAQSTGYKLHLGTGQLYSSKNADLSKKIRRDYLIDLRNKVKGIQLPTLEA